MGINCEKMTPDIVKSKITKNMIKTGSHLRFFVIMDAGAENVPPLPDQTDPQIN